VVFRRRAVILRARSFRFPAVPFGLFGLCGLTALLGLCTWQVAAGGPLCSLDGRLDRAVAGSPAFPSAAAGLLADLGDTVVALPVLVAAIGYAAWLGRRRGVPRWWLPPLAAALAMAAVPALVVPLKSLLDRPAPPGPLAGESGFYPSGHAATAAVCYGGASLLLLPHLQRRGGMLLAVVALLNVAVGAGLVRRGYHWPLDVVGSWCLSGCLLWLSDRTSRASAGGARSSPRPPPDSAGPSHTCP
jgi:membrane-associated phospholipid phosphatase